MRTRATSNFRFSEERGVALILTLGILVLITLLVVAFAVSMRVENIASKNFNDLVKARQLAQGAVDQAVGTIGAAAQPISTVTNYVTAPGVIYTWSAGTWTRTPLFTLIQPGLANTGSVDMNQNDLITGMGGIDYPAATSQLWVGWSNVVDMVHTPNQLIGRFAYWVDDESAKVNLNVAGTRLNDLEGYTPAAIDLQKLYFTVVDQVNITNYTALVRSLDSIESVRMTGMAAPLLPGLYGPNLAGDISAQVYSNNQFYVTVNSTSPDVTPWGEKRMNVSGLLAPTTTQLGTQAVVQAIANLLQDARLGAWYGGKTFGTKYPSLLQIAANIVDYIDTDNMPTDSALIWSDTGAPNYLGLEQTPYLNELVVSNAIAATGPDGSGNYTLNFSTFNTAELWYMYTNAAGWTPPSGTTEIVLLNRPTIIVTPAGAAKANGLNPLPLALPSTGTISVGSGLSISSYGTFTANDAPSGQPVTLTTNLVSVTFNSGPVTAIFRNQSSGRIDYAVILFTNYTVNIDAKLNAVTGVSWADACNDPRVKPVSNDWTPVGDGMANPITLGAANTGVTNLSVGTPPLVGDGDISCHIISGSRDRGVMYPGELSFIHTGVPWRTLSLQPQSASEVSAGMIPDWAVLDLFSATDTTDVIGRVNINSIITNSIPNLNRFRPLDALLTNGLFGTTYSLTTAANNIYYYALPPVTSVNPPPGLFSPFSYTMAGEVANTQSLSNTTPGSKRDREAPVRGIANLITTRSNTFTIWAIAQTIKDINRDGAYTPGIDLITGEAKVQVIVERTVDNSSGTPQVKFRTLYYRYLYN